MNETHRDVLRALSAENCEFLVVGAYALSSHGYTRSTGDIDILVRPTAENASRVWQALVRFGAPLARITADDFTKLDVVFQMGLPPNRIDLLTEISGVSFDEAWDSRVEASEGTIKYFVLGVAARQFFGEPLASAHYIEMMY